MFPGVTVGNQIDESLLNRLSLYRRRAERAWRYNYGEKAKKSRRRLVDRGKGSCPLVAFCRMPIRCASSAVRIVAAVQLVQSRRHKRQRTKGTSRTATRETSRALLYAECAESQ